MWGLPPIAHLNPTNTTPAERTHCGERWWRGRRRKCDPLRASDKRWDGSLIIFETMETSSQ